MNFLQMRYFVVALLIKIAFARELVIRIEGGPLVAELLAMETGHHYKGPVIGFDDTYVLIPIENTSDIFFSETKRSQESRSLTDDQRVLWAEEQSTKQRQKRDFIEIDPADVPKQRVKRVSTEVPNETITKNINKTRTKRAIPGEVDQIFNDELWNQQWYLRDTRTRLDLPKLDLNVLPVYKAGVTGRGIRITILDDGLEYTHDDLSPNYDPEISYNCNEENNDPMPRYELNKKSPNSHGTRCAGEVAMVANNKKCGVGIAFNARIGGVKMLDGLVTDRIEGTALGYAQNLVDIYSASWGPNDDGKTVDGPGRLATEAIERGIRKGRNGKGCIYVWASGNGGSRGDNCNCDGYLASPYTISIGSASQKGEFPWYGEACASTLAVTYSSGAYKDQMIATTDLNNQCTIKHTGTSASAPLAAGIIALALEVNPSLTWRDVQHLIVWTSELAPVSDNPGWQRNAAGLWFSTKFGFGLMNALGLVAAAANWTTVPEDHVCKVLYKMNNNQISYGKPAKLVAETTGCKRTKNEVVFLEHVLIRITINYTVRGALEIHLTSPAGSTVQLLTPRQYDKSPDGFFNWTFMSVMTWGELAPGVWTLTISDNMGPEGNTGYVEEAELILRGTNEPPAHMFSGPRNYNEDYNRIHNRVGAAKFPTFPQFFSYDYYSNNLK